MTQVSKYPKPLLEIYIKQFFGQNKSIDIKVYENEFSDWYKQLQSDKELQGSILSNLVTKFSEVLYKMVPDGMIAYLFETSLYKGYLLAEYFIHRNAYKKNEKIIYTTKAQAFIAELRLYELEDEYTKSEGLVNEKLMNDIIDNYFHDIVKNDEGSYEHVIVEDQRDGIAATSKYYMLMGMLYRFMELKVEYQDFPKKTNIDILKEDYFSNDISLGKLYKFVTGEFSG